MIHMFSLLLAILPLGLAWILLDLFMLGRSAVLQPTLRSMEALA